MDFAPRDPFFLVLVIVAVSIEWAVRLGAGRSYDWRAARASFGLAAGRIIAVILFLAIVAPAYAALWAAAPIKLPADDWRVWAAGFVAVEFAYYWMHRMSHQVRWMWASHAVHHTSEELNFPAALRLGWTDVVSGGWLFFAPLIVAGFHPLMIVTLLAANLKFQFLLHTELIGKLGVIESVFNTPSNHRVHHASNPRYLDCNFGGVTVIFDRMFGTYAREDGAEPLRCGLSTPLRSANPLVIAFHEWRVLARELRQCRTAAEILHALIGGPGAAATMITTRTKFIAKQDEGFT